MINENTIFNLMDSGEVLRFHSSPGITKQKVSEHSWGVAMLCQYLYPEGSKDLLLAAMTHDCAEIKTGDIPAPVKWEDESIKAILDKIEDNFNEEHGIQFYKNLNETEKKVLKMADVLDGMIYCVRRLDHGELLAVNPYDKWYDYLKNNHAYFSTEKEPYEKLSKMVHFISSYVGVNHGSE